MPALPWGVDPLGLDGVIAERAHRVDNLVPGLVPGAVQLNAGEVYLAQLSETIAFVLPSARPAASASATTRE